tara:strand:+ start:1628 stop:2056 length:429 start_codon:yes stop_codon:yes gene_type:complete
MLNKCILIGNIVEPPEEREAGSKTVLTFRLKTWETSNGKRYDGYHTINIWSDYVKKAARSFTKDQMVMVVGKYTTRMVEKNGQKAYYSSLTASSAVPASMEGITVPQEETSSSYNQPPNGGGRGPVNTGNPAPRNNSEDIPF